MYSRDASIAPRQRYMDCKGPTTLTHAASFSPTSACAIVTDSSSLLAITKIIPKLRAAVIIKCSQSYSTGTPAADQAERELWRSRDTEWPGAGEGGGGVPLATRHH